MGQLAVTIARSNDPVDYRAAKNYNDLMQSGEMPLAVVFDGDDGEREIALGFSREGWRVAQHSYGEDLQFELANPPALVVIDPKNWRGPQMWQDSPWRRTAVAVASVERSASNAALRAAGFDDRLDNPIAPDAVNALANRWRPLPQGAATRRLVASFGVATMEPMLVRFADLLEDALMDMTGTSSRALAHRVAGVAGTLGFEELGRHWLALSEGDETKQPDARIASRLAIGTILRGG